MVRRVILSAIVAVLAASGFGCKRTLDIDSADFPMVPPITMSWDKPLMNRPYRIQIGDRLGVRFLYEPTLDDEVVVRPDGRISLVPVDDVDAAGLSPDELDKVLTEKFAQAVKQTDLSVIVREPAAQRAFIGGEVMVPSMIELNSNMSVFTALLQVGGPRTTAALHNVLLIRRGEGQKWYIKRIDVEQMMKDGTGDIRLASYDVVFVPRTAIADVGVFVDQYINRIIPNAAGFSAIYNINPELEVNNN